MPKHLTTDDASDFVATNAIGATNGVAPLGEDAKVPSIYLPESGSSAVESVNGQTGDVLLSASSVGAVAASAVGNPNGVAPLDSTGRMPVNKMPLVAIQTVNGYTGPNVTLSASDLGVMSEEEADARYVQQDDLVFNAKDHGAVIDGTTDDAPAINALLASVPAGATVFLPPGEIGTLSPITVPPGKTLRGPRRNLMKAGLYDPVVRIKPLAGFTGAAAVQFLDQATGSYAAISAEQRVEDLMIFGGSAPAGVDGIQAKGNVQNVELSRVTIRDMTGNGIYTGDNAGVFPYSWRLFKVMLDNNHGHGAMFQLMTDLTMLDCQAIGNWAHGFILNNAANSQLSLCRSEWNGNYGYYITGSWGTGTGSGGMQMSGCGTDRNGWSGVFVDATGNGPVVISNMMTRRDGRNGGTGGGGYAGIAATNATVPLVIGDWTNYPGTDDNGSQANSPQYGGSFTGNASVQIDSAYLHANSGGLNDGGGNAIFHLGGNMVYATGSTAAPVRTVPDPGTGGGGGSSVGTAAAKFVVALDASDEDKARADYLCDGTADNVQIQAALAEGEGVVQLSSGTFNLAAQIAMEGLDDVDADVALSLRGAGAMETKLVVGSGVASAINLSKVVQPHLSDFGITISGTSHGITSATTNGAASGHRSFWNGTFKNLKIDGSWDGAHSGWALNLGSPFRSTFENIEVGGVGNGVRMFSEHADFNPGDFTWTRSFVEMSGNNGVAYQIDSPSGTMNQTNWSMAEAYANGTGCKGFVVSGAHNRFSGINLEQFQTLAEVPSGEGNVFEFNYVTCKDGGASNKAFVCGTGAWNNTFRAKKLNIHAGDTVTAVQDANTSDAAPNIFERICIEANTGSTTTYTKVASTVFRDITAFLDGGTVQSGLLQYPLSTVNDPTFTPADHGLITWTHDPATLRSSSNTITSGTVYLHKVKISNRSTVVTNIHIGLETAGTGLTSARNFVGLYSSSGTRLAVSADQTSAWASAGGKTIALTAPQTLDVGYYYVAILATGTTPPSFSMGAGGAMSVNIGLSTATARFITGPAAQTSLPASIALGSQTPNTRAHWAALS